MADIKKLSIGDSVNYTIGGKKYGANDVPRLQPSQTGNAKTSSDISRESIQKVQSQTADYNKSGSDILKSGIQSEVSNAPKPVKTIKTGTIPEKQNQNISPYKPQTIVGNTVQTTTSIPSPGTENVKTESMINREAIQKAQSQTADYYKTNAYETSKTGIQSEIQRIPRTVEAVKTGASPIPGQSGSTYKPQVQPGASPIPQAGAIHRTLSSPYVQTGNVKTQSTINSEAVQKVQSQTEDYTRTSAYNTSQAVIRDRIDKTPVNVAGIQTGSVHPKGVKIPFFNLVENTKNKPFNLVSAVTQVSGDRKSVV